MNEINNFSRFELVLRNSILMSAGDREDVYLESGDIINVGEKTYQSLLDGKKIVNYYYSPDHGDFELKYEISLNDISKIYKFDHKVHKNSETFKSVVYEQ